MENENNQSQETLEIHGDKNEDKMVPLAESIRYRKRAQGAEKISEELKSQLSKTCEEKDILDIELKDIKLDNDIMLQLNKAGVRDIEAGLALTRKRLENNGQTSIKEIVEELRSEKKYLFSKEPLIGASKTASVKAPMPEGEKVLTECAKKAAASGSRRDIQEYLRIRRNFI